MKYTITIKDNTTGKILVDEQTDCIIGAISDEIATTKFTLSDATRSIIIECAKRAFEEVKFAMRSIKADNKEVDHWMK